MAASQKSIEKNEKIYDTFHFRSKTGSKYGRRLSCAAIIHALHSLGGDALLSEPAELYTENVEMTAILPPECRYLQGDYLPEEKERKRSCVVSSNRLPRLIPIVMDLATRIPRSVAREGLSPGRCCEMIWRETRP